MPTTVGRSRGRQGVHSGAQGAAGDHLWKIGAISVTAIVVIVFMLAVTPAGRTIDAATQHFMLYYAGVLALIGLTGSVLISLVATDRIVMTPGHRVMAQAVHRAFAFGTIAFLIIHIVTEILAQRSHVIDGFIPFLSPYRTFYIGLGTIASDLIVLLVVTGILRNRYTAHGKAWRWRAIHYTSYVAFVFGVLHGLLGGRYAKPYVDWSYGFAIAITALGLAIRFLAISLRPKESLSSSPVADRARTPGSSPLHAAAMSMAQAQLGGTVQVLPAGLGARAGAVGMPAAGPWAALPAPGSPVSTGPLPALGAASSYAGQSYAGPTAALPTAALPPGGGYRDLGFTPLGAPPYGDDAADGLRGPGGALYHQPRPAMTGLGPARQPLYEPEYDGPPRFAGAPRSHVPQDELSSYPYGSQSSGKHSGGGYPDGRGDRAGSDGRAGLPPGRAEPRAALPAAGTAQPRNTGPIPAAGTGPMPRLDTGPIPRNGTGPMPRAGTGPMLRHGTGPMPGPDTGQLPRPDTGPVSLSDTGPIPRVGTGQAPRQGSGPMPRAGTGPMPRSDTGPIPRVGTGQAPRQGSGPMPRAGTGPMPLGTGPMPLSETGPIPRVGSGPMPRNGSGPMPRAGTGPMPRPDTGSLPRAGTGPMPRSGAPMPADPAPGPRTGPLPRATGRAPRRTNSDEQRYREVPGPNDGGDEWR